MILFIISFLQNKQSFQYKTDLSTYRETFVFISIINVNTYQKMMFHFIFNLYDIVHLRCIDLTYLLTDKSKSDSKKKKKIDAYLYHKWKL